MVLAKNLKLKAHIHITSIDLLYFLIKKDFVQRFLEKLCMSRKWLGRLSCFFQVICRSENETLYEEELNKVLPHSNKTIVLKAWDLNFKNALYGVSDRVRRILLPKDEFVKDAERQVSKLKLKYDCLIGIHARRTDYKDYLGGIYYHSWDQYIKWIMETKLTIERTGQKNIGFLLCSDEDPVPKIFNNLPVHFSVGNEVMIDLHALSLCDYNIGPPSSFGTWISWHGKVPRLEVINETKHISIDDFRVCNSC